MLIFVAGSAKKYSLGVLGVTVPIFGQPKMVLICNMDGSVLCTSTRYSTICIDRLTTCTFKQHDKA